VGSGIRCGGGRDRLRPATTGLDHCEWEPI